MQELWFLRFSRRQMLIDIHIKFYKDILNNFQGIKRTRFCDGQKSKETNLKSIKSKSYDSCTRHIV